MIFFKKHKFYIVSTFCIFILVLLYNHTIILNIKTALIDWLDYPLMVYIIQNNIKHLASLNFTEFNNISMYYPSPNGIYFTDILLPQSILGLIIYPFTKNYIFTFNLIFFFTIFLDIVSLHFFWSKLFKDKKIVSLLTFLFIFSPYIFSMYFHYQMLIFSFYFFSLGILLKAKNKKQYFLAGIFSGLQFISGVYIGIYSLTTTGIFFVWQLYKKKKLKDTFNNGLLFLLGFLIIAGYFVFKFAETKANYNIIRRADTYVNSAMQITDIFFNPFPSLWTTKVYYKINLYSHRLGYEAFTSGFILLFITLFGLVKLIKKKKTKQEKYFANFILLLLIWGLIAILGPRLSINGKYLAIPLPYIIPLKFGIVFEPLRVVSRWFFIVQIGLLYLTGYSLNYLFKKYSLKKSLLIITMLLTLYLIELMPIKQRKQVDTYQTQAYNYIVKNCQQNQTVLEYPFAPQLPKTTAGDNLQYWVKIILNQMHYRCQLVNGYSGFQPKHIDNYINNFNRAIDDSSIKELTSLLREKNVRYIKINKKYLLENNLDKVYNLFVTSPFKTILNNNDNLIVKYD